MLAINRLPRLATVTAWAGAALLVSAGFSYTMAGPFSGPSLTATANDLGRVLGTEVTIHAAPELVDTKTLPIVCKTLEEAVEDVAKDSASRARLSRLLNVVVIEGQRTTMHEHFVTLKDHILTIQTINDPSEAADLRSLLADVLKKILLEDEKMRSGPSSGAK